MKRFANGELKSLFVALARGFIFNEIIMGSGLDGIVCFRLRLRITLIFFSFSIVQMY